MPCSGRGWCKNCVAGLPDIYCVAPRTLSEAETKRLDEIRAARASRETEQPK